MLHSGSTATQEICDENKEFEQKNCCLPNLTGIFQRKSRLKFKKKHIFQAAPLVSYSIHTGIGM